MTGSVDPWLTVDEVAGVLGVTIDDVMTWISSSELPAIDLGPSEGARIRMTDFNAFAARLLTSARH